MRFWDTSAIVPLIVEERTSETMRSLFDRDRDVVVAVFTVVEATSAIWRRWRAERAFDLDLALTAF